MQPAAFHTPISETTKSRPARLRRNSGDRCSAHSQTETPNGSRSCSRGPRPGPMQIAHGGRFPIPRALYSVHGMAPSCARSHTPISTEQCRERVSRVTGDASLDVLEGTSNDA
jgi:hypothetical protein